MSPRTIEQYEEIRTSRTKLIMDKALVLFAEQGYSNTSISMIAEKAKISKGLMYNYFSSKEKLLIAIFEDGMNEMINLFDPNKDGVLTDEEFKFFLEEIFNLISKKRSFYKLYFALMMQPSVWKLFEHKIQKVIEPFLSLLIDYYTKKGAENPHLEAVLIGAIFDGIIINYVFNPDKFPLEEVKNLVIQRFV